MVDQVRSADVDVVITPSSDHLDAITLHALMHVVDVETVCPRMSFARWGDCVEWAARMSGLVILGLTLAVGIPAAVCVAAVCWPTCGPGDESVDSHPGAHRESGRAPRKLDEDRTG
ncbi:hypothetical protein [Nocardia wallacei]|uniref:hypothetical protein n=1 Tax=Nocardia wallacei TaxID=480035 RepID=UPI0024573ED8|nr:hypothetical protein [Nocardia wallacei]